MKIIFVRRRCGGGRCWLCLRGRSGCAGDRCALCGLVFRRGRLWLSASAFPDHGGHDIFRYTQVIQVNDRLGLELGDDGVGFHVCQQRFASHAALGHLDHTGNVRGNLGALGVDDRCRGRGASAGGGSGIAFSARASGEQRAEWERGGDGSNLVKSAGGTGGVGLWW